MGPMTGRGAGYCSGNAGREIPYPVAGSGYGMGFGRGRGCGWRMGRNFGRGGGMRFGRYDTPYGYPGTYGQPDPNLEKQALAGQARSLQAELEVIQKRLAALESEPTTD
jgi:uncharacterized protein DUF5320